MIRFTLLLTCLLVLPQAVNAAAPELPSETLPTGKERPAVEQEFYQPLAPVPSLATQLPMIPFGKRFEEVTDWVEVAQRRAVAWGLFPGPRR